MSLKTKLLCIFTFGIYYLIIKQKAQKKLQMNNETLVTNSKVNFNFDKLYDAIGGLNNIEEVIASLSSIKITCKNINLINSELLNKLDSKGNFISNNKITLLIGDISHTVATKINEQLNNQKDR